MRFRFNDRKTAQAAAYLLKLSGGRLNYMVLIKLLYLADREMLLQHGQPITGDRLIAMKHGPVLSRVLDFINEGPHKDSHAAWFEYIGEPERYDVALVKEDPPTDELSRFELGLLSRIHQTYSKIDKWELVKVLHSMLPEWQDPGDSSSKIEPEEILRAAGRSDLEVDRVRRDADELWFLDSIGRQ